MMCCTMAPTVLNSPLSASAYNQLPYIQENNTVPHDYSEELSHLRNLLTKHQVPKDITIRLIHRHFDAVSGEVVVFDKKSIEGHGLVQTMLPVDASSNTTLNGLHYFVNSDGFFQAYEYSTFPVPDISPYQEFLHEFANFVCERGLQFKFGLKLKCLDETDSFNWTEYELLNTRGTIMLQEGMPMPKDNVDGFSVSTEWKSSVVDDGSRDCRHTRNCSHGNRDCKHVTVCKLHAAQRSCEEASSVEVKADTMYNLGGELLQPGTALHHIVQEALCVC